jgi:hypothetical protein
MRSVGSIWRKSRKRRKTSPSTKSSTLIDKENKKKKIMKGEKTESKPRTIKKIDPEKLVYTFKSSRAGNLVYLPRHGQDAFVHSKAPRKINCAVSGCGKHARYRLPMSSKFYCSASCYQQLKALTKVA